MDRVKLYAQERLDLDDANALQSLVYDYVQEALGGLFGRIRGALSVPTITQTENSGAPYIVSVCDDRADLSERAERDLAELGARLLADENDRRHV
jgi:hypothetical protein